MKDTSQTDKGNIGEDYVNELAFNSYLKYWCYPNPKDEEGDRKEICDLLILFRNTAIIISVKNYENSGNYERYKKRVIEKSSSQLYGAERKLFNSNRSIKIKHPEKKIENFTKDLYSSVYRITINVGEQFEYYDLGDSKLNKGFINIFNKDTFDKVIQELDTIPDLVEYLYEREKLLKSYIKVYLKAKESDLLAVFLRNKRKFPNDFYNLKVAEVSISIAGEWEKYNKHALVKRKRDQNKYSYFIDNLVKNDILKLSNGEILAKELMSLNRVERRYISKALLTLIAKHQKNDEIEFARRYLSFKNFGWLFIYYSDKIKDENLDRMIFEITPSLYAYKTNCSDKYIIVLAGNDYLKQWKFGFFESPELPLHPQAIKYFEVLIEQLGWFNNMEIYRYREEEYPQ